MKVDPYRRNLQRAFVDLASSRVNAAQASGDDNRALFRGELRGGRRARRPCRTTDAETQRHLQDLRAEMAKALDPSRPTAPTRPRPRPSRGGRRRAPVGHHRA